jgi:hypothetical protein
MDIALIYFPPTLVQVMYCVVTIIPGPSLLITTAYNSISATDIPCGERYTFIVNGLNIKTYGHTYNRDGKLRQSLTILSLPPTSHVTKLTFLCVTVSILKPVCGLTWVNDVWRQGTIMIYQSSFNMSVAAYQLLVWSWQLLLAWVYRAWWFCRLHPDLRACDK